MQFCQHNELTAKALALLEMTRLIRTGFTCMLCAGAGRIGLFCLPGSALGSDLEVLGYEFV